MYIASDCWSTVEKLNVVLSTFNKGKIECPMNFKAAAERASKRATFPFEMTSRKNQRSEEGRGGEERRVI